MMNNYLYQKIPRSKIDETYSLLEKIALAVPQGLVLRPILFNIPLGDLFLILNEIDIAIYADDNTFIKQLTMMMMWSKLSECQLKIYLNGLRIMK